MEARPGWKIDPGHNSTLDSDPSTYPPMELWFTKVSKLNSIDLGSVFNGGIKILSQAGTAIDHTRLLTDIKKRPQPSCWYRNQTFPRKKENIWLVFVKHYARSPQSPEKTFLAAQGPSQGHWTWFYFKGHH